MAFERIDIPDSLARDIAAEARAPEYGGDCSAVIQKALNCLYALQDCGAIPHTRAIRAPLGSESEARKKISINCDLGDQKDAWDIWLQEYIAGENNRVCRKLLDEQFKCLVMEYRNLTFATITEVKADYIRLIGVIDTLHSHTKNLVKDMAASFLIKTDDRAGRKTIEATVATLMIRLRTAEKYLCPSPMKRSFSERDRAVSFILGLTSIYENTDPSSKWRATATKQRPFYKMVYIGLSAINHLCEDPEKLIRDANLIRKEQNRLFKSNLRPKLPTS